MDLTAIASWNVLPSDPVASVGHGAILDAEGKAASGSSLEDVLQAQAFYLKSLAATHERDLAGELREIQMILDRTPALDVAEQLAINHLLISALIERVRPMNGAAVASKSSAPLAAASRGAPRDAIIRPELLKALQAAALLAAMGPRSDPDRVAYIEQCREAGVPIPPDWGPRGRREGLPGTRLSLQHDRRDLCLRGCHL